MIKINDKYFIDATTHECVLKEYKGKIVDKKTGLEKDDYTDLGYYNNPESAFKGFIKNEIRKFIGKKEINTLEELTKKIEEIQNFAKEKLGDI